MTDLPHAQLRAMNGANPVLQGLRLSGDLRGLLFEARVEQRYLNSGAQPIELVYTFPLPWGAVLLEVEVQLGEQRLSGQVRPKRQAEADYEAALSDGDAALLLERNADQSYTLNLGNLAAGETCRIVLCYAQTLQFEQRGLRLLIPTVIAPRYGDPVRDGGLRPHQAPTHDLQAEYPFDLALRLHGPLARSRIGSPSHPIRTELSGHHDDECLTVTLGAAATLDRDLVLVLDRLTQHALAQQGHDPVAPGVAVLASFCPHLPQPAPTPIAVKILVDCSGSMAGDSIAAARRALQAIVQAFAPDDTFSLSRFGTTVEHRSRALWAATERARLTAQRWVGDLDATLGGTEMAEALASTFALAQAGRSDVLLITDGEISAIDATIEVARQSGHRLFIVGIGSSPAQSHLQRLAEATQGACDFVAPGAAVEPAVLHMFARLRSPRLSALTLRWPDGIEPLWSEPLGSAVFDGDTVHVHALLREPAPDGVVRLLARRSPDAALEDIGSARLAAPIDDSDTLARLSATRRLATSTDATALAVAYRLITDDTSFLLVHERAAADKALDMPVLHKVAQMLPAGWGAAGGIRACMSAAPSRRMAADTELQELACCCLPFDLSDEQPFDESGMTFADSPADQDDPAITPHIPDTPPPRVVAMTPTPQGLIDWLQNHAPDTWPTSYLALDKLRMRIWVVIWLEQNIGLPHGGAEEVVMATFLALFAQAALQAALQQPGQTLGSVWPLARLDDISQQLARDDARIDARLARLMLAELQDTTGACWPKPICND